MRQKRIFYISGGCYLLSSASIFLMSFGDLSGEHGSRVLAVVSAVLFWLLLLIAIIAQLRLRRIQKRYRRKIPVPAMILSPPTVWFALMLILSVTTVNILTAMNTGGFALYFFIFMMLASAEMTFLTMGKFARKDGRLVMMIYRPHPVLKKPAANMPKGNANTKRD